GVSDSDAGCPGGGTNHRVATDPAGSDVQCATTPLTPVTRLPSPNLIAAAVPASADPEPAATADEKQLVISYGERRYRVRGWPKQLGEALKVNILVNLAGDERAD